MYTRVYCIAFKRDAVAVISIEVVRSLRATWAVYLLSLAEYP